MSTEQVSIPARLSDPQLFTLAAIREHDELRRWEVNNRAYLGDCLESGGPLERHALGGSSLQSAIRDEFPDLERTSVPRALQRLDERDLVTRWRGSWSSDSYSRILPDHSKGDWLRLVMLTHRGGRVAGEVLRRHEDGRYSLSFSTLE